MVELELLQIIEEAQYNEKSFIDLSNCNLTHLPKEIAELTKLQELYLSNNQLTELPKEISQLTNLRRLYLSNNQLTELPKEIAELTKLQELYLSNNQLTELPKEISHLSNLKLLDVRENLMMAPVEILNDINNPQKIINYLQSLNQDFSVPINEAKIMVVGEAGVGKTSLINRLLFDKFNPNEKSTHGTNIYHWTPTINNQNVSLNMWDFGGQEIMHATHLFFFTKRTLYLLVVNARQNVDQNRLEYWLQKIKSLGGNSPVIIVGNKIDENAVDINRHDLLYKYPNIKGFYSVSCDISQQQYNVFFDEFKKGLIKQIGELEGLFIRFPKSWSLVKEKLKMERIPYITYDEYIRICFECGIISKIDQEKLIEALHDFGLILSFRHDSRLRDTNVLNPEWVTNGVYSIVNSSEIHKNKGVFDSELLTRVLNPEVYPLNQQLFIVDIMRKFELCFDIERDKKFLVPDLLPMSEPDYTGEWENCLKFQYQYAIYFDSVLTRFIVRTHKYIYKNSYWRRGVVLKFENNIVLVRGDAYDRKITIYIEGNNSTRRETLAIVRNEFNYIHSKFTNFEVSENVYHPDFPNVKGDYKRLLAMEEHGIEFDFVTEIGKEVSVKEWLEGIENSATRQRSRMIRFSDEINYIGESNRIVSKDEEKLLLLEENLLQLKSIKETLDRESEMIVKTRLIIVLMLSLIITSAWISLIWVVGWERLEILTYLIGVGAFLIGYIYFAIVGKDLNPFKIRESLTEREKQKLYRRFEFNSDEFQKLLQRLNESRKKTILKL